MYTKNYRKHKSSTKDTFSLKAFNERFFHNLDAQREVFTKIKFPNGFICPECGCTHYKWMSTRNAMYCPKCFSQYYLFANTIFQDTKLDLYTILLGIYYFVSSQSGINGTTLAVYLGVNVNTARLFLRKLRVACENETAMEQLKGLVYLDGGYFGGVDEGGKRGAGSDKQTVMVAVEMIPVMDKEGTTKREFPGKAAIKLVKSENGVDILDFIYSNTRERFIHSCGQRNRYIGNKSSV